MIRIRLGDSWRHDPSCLRALVALAERRSTGFSPRDIVDAVRIEVDGVDLTRGRAETSLVDALVALRAATAGPHAIALGPLALHVEPAQDEVLLRFASEEGIVRAAVDALSFSEAVAGSAAALVQAFRSIHPSLADHRVSRLLLGRPPREARPTRPLRPRTAKAVPAPAKPRPSRPPRRARLALPEEGLRRLLYRRTWRATVTAGSTVEPFGRGLLFRTARRVEWRLPGGAPEWSAPLSESCLAHGVLIGRDGEMLVGLNERGGELFRLRLPPGSFFVCAGKSGRSPALRILTAGEQLRCVTTTGDVLWSRPGEGSIVAATSLPADRVVLTGLSSIRCLSLRDGAELWQRDFPGRLVQHVAPWGRSLAVGVDESLFLLQCETGAIRWERTPSGAGRVHPQPAQGLVWVPRLGAGLSGFDRTGEEECHLPPLDTDPSLSPLTPRPMPLAGGLGLVRGAWTHVVELSSGRPVATLEAAELGPASAILLPDRQVVLVASDGTVDGWTPNGYLQVPRLPPEAG